MQFISKPLKIIFTTGAIIYALHIMLAPTPETQQRLRTKSIQVIEHMLDTLSTPR